MFTEISWEEYLLTTLAIAILYYLAVLYLKFRTEIKNLFSKSCSMQGKNEVPNLLEPSLQIKSSNVDLQDGSTEEKDLSENDSLDIDRFIESIQNTFSSRKSLDIDNVTSLLRELFNTNSNIKQSSYRSSINEFIQSEGEKYGHVMPSEAEIDVLWDERA